VFNGKSPTGGFVSLFFVNFFIQLFTHMSAKVGKHSEEVWMIMYWENFRLKDQGQNIRDKYVKYSYGCT
jgi:hypothetical protein